MGLQYYLPKVLIILCLQKVNNDNDELFYAQPIIGTNARRISKQIYIVSDKLVQNFETNMLSNHDSSSSFLSFHQSQP